MTEGWKSIALDVFEHVVTGPSQSLLRVSGKAAPGSETAPKPTLVVGAAPAQQHFAPLRAPQDRGGVLRAAYAVPTALVQSGAPCWLEFEDGEQTELPVPAEGTARMRDADGDADGASAALPEPLPALSGLSALSESLPAPELDTTAAELSRTQADLARARDELAALDQQIAELERAREDDRRAATTAAVQAQSRLELAEQRAKTAERELGAAKEEAARAAASVAPLERRAAELEQAALTAQARIQTLERDLAGVAAAREALQREVAKLRGRQSTLERELDKARDQLRIMAFERDEFSRQAAAFDGVAVKARERAVQAEAANEKATAALHELQIWRGELERRLAETTSELGAARAARETDERELMRLRTTVDEYDRGLHSGDAARNHGEP